MLFTLAKGFGAEDSRMIFRKASTISGEDEVLGNLEGPSGDAEVSNFKN